MKVYLVIDFDYVVKVFAKEEDAATFIEENKNSTFGFPHKHYDVQEYDVE
jgi:hypothetical protein